MDNSREKAKEKKGERVMKLNDALNLSFKDFSDLDQVCHGFNGEVYKNQALHHEGESFWGFTNKGSARIKNNPIIIGNLT